MPILGDHIGIRRGDWLECTHPNGGVIIGQAIDETRLGTNAFIRVRVSIGVDVEINVNFWNIEIMHKNMLPIAVDELLSSMKLERTDPTNFRDEISNDERSRLSDSK